MDHPDREAGDSAVVQGRELMGVASPTLGPCRTQILLVKKTQAPNGSSGEQWGMFDASYICLNIVLTDGFE